MALRLCLGCSTAYAIGLQACPQCGSPTRNAIYDWESDAVAKANNETGATLYVAEGAPVPDDAPAGVRLVGPGAPQDTPEPAPEPEPEPEVVPDPTPAPTPARASTPKLSSAASSAAADDDADADDA